MGVLTLIWISAVLLSAGSVAWMTALIGLRFVHERLTLRRRRDRAAIERAFVAALSHSREAGQGLEAYQGRASVLAETLLGFLDIVRGKDRQAVLATLAAAHVDEALRRAVNRGGRADRVACVEALAAFPGPETAGVLRRVADENDDWQLRMAALTSLVAIGAPPSIGRLLDELMDGRLPSGRAADLIRAVVVGEPRAAMLALRRADLTGAARTLLLEGLGAAGDYDAIPLLVVHVEASDPAVRAAAVAALGVMMHPAAGEAVARALNDPAWPVRSAAAEAAGAARLAALADSLVARLADPVWRVRFQAGAALAKLGEAGLSRLRRAAEEDDANVRRAASVALLVTSP